MAMIYNEYAQVLETTNPATGELYQPEDLNVINYNDVGTAMLQDAIWARAAWLAEPGNEDIATKFLAASFEGWQYCRDNPDECVDIVLDQQPHPRRRPSGVDDERGQRADLAGRGRHRRHADRHLGPDGPDRAGRRDHPGRADRGRLSDRPRRRGAGPGRRATPSAPTSRRRTSPSRLAASSRDPVAALHPGCRER